MDSYVAKCMVCQQLKVENMRPGGLYKDIAFCWMEVEGN